MESGRSPSLQRKLKLYKQALKTLRIGVDLMGNDNSPEKLLQTLEDLALPSSVQLVAVGTGHSSGGKVEYISASSFIEMDEHPLNALRRKKGASLCVGLRKLKEGGLDAFISAGNTGALVSASKMIVKTLPKVLRPALLARIPTKKEALAVLDVGANVQVKATHLVQFAHLGAADCRARGIEKPVVGLLNIGSEPLKGTSELQKAYQTLSKAKDLPFSFVGNIEGKSVFEGDVDVLVTDGFTGNIFLKTSEGIASLILDRFGALIPATEYKNLRPKIQDLQRNLHYAEHPGALLIGLQKPVIKCHGYSTPQAFANAVIGVSEWIGAGFAQKFETLYH